MASDKQLLNKNIGRFFDQESTARILEYEQYGLTESAQIHLHAITAAHPHFVIDVGSGSGGLVLELLAAGIQQVVGVDLSSHMNVLARDRLTKYEYTGGEFVTADFLDVTYVHADAISFHKSLCCHPQREALLAKSIQLQPSIFVITIPRDWKVLQFAVNFYYKLLYVMGLQKLQYRPHIHSQQVIDDQLQRAGYNVSERHFSLFWITTIYVK